MFCYACQIGLLKLYHSALSLCSRNITSYLLHIINTFKSMLTIKSYFEWVKRRILLFPKKKNSAPLSRPFRPLSLYIMDLYTELSQIMKFLNDTSDMFFSLSDKRQFLRTTRDIGPPPPSRATKPKVTPVCSS